MPRKKISDFEDLKKRDADHDGLSDYEEIFIYHTDPLEPFDYNDKYLQRANIDLFNDTTLYMKDFFIPSSNNNYKPHALKTKRLFFYSLTAVFIKILVIAFVFVFPVTAWLTPDLLKTESQKIVVLTNDLRQSLGLEQLKNNEVLESAALAKAEDMVVKQYFAHISPENMGLKYWLSSKGYKYEVAGENLAIGFSTPEEVLQAWKNSPTHYANLMDTDYNEIGVAMVAGNYQGYDTTLVAQMFGKQKNIAKTEQESVVIEVQEVGEETAVEKSVLAVKSVGTKKLAPLPTPSLVENISGLLTKEDKVTLNILAPEATSVSILVNDQLSVTSKVEDGRAQADLKLSLGQNKIVLQAIDGKRQSRSADYFVEYDNQAPILDASNSFVSVVQGNKSREYIVKVEALLSDDTRDAFVRFHDFNIALQMDIQNKGLWFGNRVVENVDEQFFSPTVPATLVASDKAGNILTQDLAWRQLVLDKASRVNQYLFIKNTDSDYLQPLFNISSWYYRAMILLAVLALILNVFIEIKKQHPKTIASTVGFVILLAILLIF